MAVRKKSQLALFVRAVIYSAIPLMLLDAPSLHAREVTFDTDILKSRGLGADLNRYFAQAPRFLPGTHSVSVKVNGNDRGTAAVRFSEDGTMCVDNDFLEFAGLMPVPIKANETCHDLRSDYAQAVINPLPNQEAVELYLPAEALNSLSADVKNFQHGGTAGMLNYSLFSTKNEYSGSDSSSNRYSQASLEAGFNAMDWSLRSRYILTDDNGNRNAESIYTYAEHVFVPQRLTMQVGEINAMSDVLSGVPITGVQLMPTSGLQKDSSGVSVSGIARTSQARVEVRQNGRLIFNTLVPAGPFTLDDVPMVRNNVDLDVTVVESDGSTNRYIVPAASVKARNLSKPNGLTVSAGQVRGIDSDYSDPLVFNVSDGWRIFPWMNLLASGVVAEDYQAAGARTEFMVTDGWNVSTSMAASNAQFGDSNNGIKNELQSDYSLTENVGLSASVAHYSGDYRELADAMDDDYQGYDNSYSANVRWSTELAGAFSAGLSYNQAAGDGEDSRYLLLSWGKTFKYASINVNWQSAVGSTDDDQDDDLLYINLSIPLGGSQSLSSYMRKQGDSTSYGLANSGSLGENTNYYISADRDDESQENSFNGNINTNLHYTQLSVGGGTSGDHQRNYNATLSGGIAMHKDGVTFSPYSIKDTFAIARLSEPKAGVEITTPQGTVWTDRWGQAVIPGLTEWRNSRIEVDANKLPQSMTLANGTKYIAAAHGSVSEVSFKVLNSRRVMLRIKQADGKPLTKGLSVVDDKNNYVVTVVDDGHVFLNDADQISALYAVDDDNNRLCKLDFTLPEKHDEDAFYEEVNGVCR
ncbi:fimbrial biogenesis outer membrane usher protein [Enterobacter cloacae]|uniref:fimbrial biogenesis outer membrane usher protein n=1 Tax=Enterobacter cloacae TaxID=550 RepID=UPI0005892284|nr:fimbrial biogenesis outer membrane usher protein [Enterobacter cloacae]KIF95635.1 fimbrial assembly protein [Enterobacter cloacae]MCK6711290.1 fimbrial biogenesis outer membrane usher protein [Enterobacter cloacae]MCK6744447.1 fimbrial biogenesis outer membrane usher protein [Enterobacter cloacae]MCK6784496.1 fimbrial biogenesis outer membrane usher protein [Enterobacter cloacae]MCK7267518.1 fimbrial biogenesis outer membrane usher protein [Enterobacter cloacae]